MLYAILKEIKGGTTMKMYVKIREILKEKGMTQKDLAEKTGIAPTTISFICRDTTTTLNKEHISRIAEVLGIQDFNELLGWKA